MSTAIPPAPPPAPSSSTGGSGPVSLTVTANPEALAGLAEGALIDALAQSRAAKGVITVQTATGTLELKANGQLPPIPPGATLLFQVVNKDGELSLRLLAINGRPLGGFNPSALPGGVTMGGLLSPNSGTNSLGLIGLPQNPAGQPNMTALAGQTITLPGGAPGPLGMTATIIRPAIFPGMPPGTPFGPDAANPAAQPGMLTGGLPPNLPVGTQITVRIAGVNPPQGEPGMPALPGALPGTVPAQPGQQSVPGQSVPGQPVPGHPAQAGAGAGPSSLPGAAQPTPFTATTTAPPPLLSGTVTAQPPGGHAVVQTPVGTLAVPTQMDLPAGTPLTLEVVGKPIPPPPATALPQASSDGLGAQGWPNFTQAADVLAANNQNQALEQLLRVMPQAGPRLAASMAMFASALRNGEVRALMPENSVRGLEKAGKKELAEKLTSDLESLSEDSARPLGNGEWRGFTMPFLNGAVVDPIQLFVRATGGEAKRKGGSGNDERFVLDIKLSQLGRVQLDGLVRREDKLFDLIIRTDAPLPVDAKHNILGIFTNAAELVGTKGTVVFQSGARWVEFPPAPPTPTRIEV